MGGGLGDTIVLIVLLLLVIFAAYFTTKFLSSKTKNLTRCKYIQLKDRMFVGRDKHILLLEVGDQVFLVGITNQSINVIGTLQKDKIVPLTEEKQTASVISGLKGFMGKVAGFMKQTSSAREDLKKAREQYKQDAGASHTGGGNENADDIEKMLASINQRKSRFQDNRDNKGDGK